MEITLKAATVEELVAMINALARGGETEIKAVVDVPMDIDTATEAPKAVEAPKAAEAPKKRAKWSCVYSMKNPDLSEHPLTAADAARLIGVSQVRIGQLCREGMPHIRTKANNGKLYLNEKEVMYWWKNHKVERYPYVVSYDSWWTWVNVQILRAFGKGQQKKVLDQVYAELRKDYGLVFEQVAHDHGLHKNAYAKIVYALMYEPTKEEAEECWDNIFNDVLLNICKREQENKKGREVR